MRRILVGMLLAVSIVPAGITTFSPARAQDTAPFDVAEFLERSAPSLTSFRAVRYMTASARGGRMTGFLRVRTTLDGQQFTYEVLEEGGSSTIRKRVLLAALDAERETHVTRTGARGALTTDNYEFVRMGDTGEPIVEVALKPRRHETMLIEGAMFLTRDTADLVRVEGELVKRPSFWTKKVEVTRKYGRIAGVRVPLEMESVAQMRLVGTATFSMTYQYEMINGAELSADGATQPADRLP
jgi:hypothetical protein